MAKSPMKSPDVLHDYVMGHDSIPSSKQLKKYQETLYELLKKKYPKRYVTVYRGFSDPSDRYEIGEVFRDSDALISFTLSKSTAVEIAEQRSRDSNEFGYAIRLDIPIEQIYFHYAFDPLGKEHPKEKEVLINPYGFDWEIIHFVKPRRNRE